MTAPGDEFDDLPVVLAEVARVGGRGLALRLADTFGGSQLYVQRVPKPGALLADRMGLDAARLIARAYGGEMITVPTAGAARRPGVHREIRRRLEAGDGVQKIARDLGVNYKAVQRIKKRIESETEPELLTLMRRRA